MPKLGKKDFKYERSDTVEERERMDRFKELTKDKLEASLSKKRGAKATTKHANEFAHLEL